MVFPANNPANLGDAPAVYWRGDGGGDVSTWEQVQSIVNANAEPTSVVLGGARFGPYVIPPSTTNMRRGGFLSRDPGDVPTIEMQDGASLFDLAELSGVNLRCRPTLAPALVFPTTVQPIFYFDFRTVLENLGTTPMIEWATTGGAPLTLFFSRQSGAFSPSSTAPIVGLHPGALCVLVFDFCGISSQIPTASITGDATNAVLVIHDGTMPTWPILPGFLGLTANVPAGVVGGAGPTANRPLPFIGPLKAGLTYFDTTLGKPIFWNGAAWTDALGVPV